MVSRSKSLIKCTASTAKNLQVEGELQDCELRPWRAAAGLRKNIRTQMEQGSGSVDGRLHELIVGFPSCTAHGLLEEGATPKLASACLSQSLPPPSAFRSQGPCLSAAFGGHQDLLVSPLPTDAGEHDQEAPAHKGGKQRRSQRGVGWS